MTSESEADVEDLLVLPSPISPSSISGESSQEEEYPSDGVDTESNDSDTNSKEEEQLPDSEVETVIVDMNTVQEINNNKSNSKALSWNGDRLYPPARSSN